MNTRVGRFRPPNDTKAAFVYCVQSSLRLVVGFGFMMHGAAKLSRGADSFSQILNALHVPLPGLVAWATILVELLGGLAILMGTCIHLVSVPLAAVLLGAIFSVHLQNGFSSIKLLAATSAGPEFGPPGFECPLLYLVCLANLVVGAPRSLSIGRFLRRLGKE